MATATSLGGGGLRLKFARRADRLGHQIELACGDGQLVLESIEGTGDDSWPPSPPIQDLQVVDRPAGSSLILGVGRAGRSHWSLSVELDERAGTLKFDVACRAAGTPVWLGSGYAITAGEHLWGAGEPQNREPSRFWDFDSLTAGSAPAHWAARAAAQPGRAAAQPGRVLLAGAVCRTADWPQTIRWTYSIRRLASQPS